MANEYFQPGSIPAPNSPGSSAVMRQEFASIAAGFDKLPVLAGNANELVAVNSTGTALTTSGAKITDYVTKDGVFTLTNKTIAWSSNTFPGFGTGATKNAGLLADNVLLLSENNKLPAIDGSLLTGLNVGMISGVVAISKGGTGASDLAGAQTALGIDLKADAFDAVLTGAPTAPTPPTGDNSARIATTYFVTETIQAIGSFAPSNAMPLMNGVASAGVGALGSRDDHVHPTDTTRAPVASPALTGTPTAPTAPADTSTTQLATTAFVVGQASAATPLMSGTAAVGTSVKFARGDHRHPTDTTRAPLASPTFTGIPAAPTPATNNNTTQIATTAFVQSLIAQQPPGVQVSNSAPVMNGVAAAGVGVEASRWDHVHPSDTSKLSLTGGTLSGTLQFSTAVQSVIARNGTDGQMVVSGGTGLNGANIQLNGSTRSSLPNQGQLISGSTPQLTWSPSGVVANTQLAINTTFISGFSLTTDQPIRINQQGTDITPGTGWGGQVTAIGAGYQGGLALDATGLWVGHNSATRHILFATQNTERMRISAAGAVTIASTQMAVGGPAIAAANQTFYGGNIAIAQDFVANSAKTSRIYSAAFSGNPLTMMLSSSSGATSNNIQIGGGTSGGEPATSVSIATGPVGALGAGTVRVTVTDNTTTINNGLQVSSVNVTGTPAAADGNVFSGTYTPTLVAGSLTGTATAVAFGTTSYTRIGNQVIVAGTVQVTTSGAGIYGFQMTLPVSAASAFTTASGGGSINDSNGTGGRMITVSGQTNRAQCNSNTAGALAASLQSFTFSYRVA